MDSTYNLDQTVLFEPFEANSLLGSSSIRLSVPVSVLVEP